MKLFIIILLCISTTTAKKVVIKRKYIPPRRTAAGSKFTQAPHLSSETNHRKVTGYFGKPIVVLDNSYKHSQAERNVAVLNYEQSIVGDTYSYVYKTDNGIYAEEKGVATNGVRARGGYSYIGDDGKMYSIRYTADENGFVPQGDHLPKPPPIPKEILRALEQNARDEAAGIFDDGSYDEVKYLSRNQNQYYKQSDQPYNKVSGVRQRKYLSTRNYRTNQSNRYRKTEPNL